MRKVIIILLFISFACSSCMRNWVEDCPTHNNKLFTRQQRR